MYASKHTSTVIAEGLSIIGTSAPMAPFKSTDKLMAI